MLIRPDRGDIRLVALYVGRILTGMGLVMVLPGLLGVVRGELDDALGFVIGSGAAITIGQLADWRLTSRRPLGWSHALVVVAVAWLAAAFVGAVPLFLSGHYTRFLDAYFDAMSGLATAGLAVINDLDHLSDSVNLWRHLLQFLGGQGLVLVALSLFTSGGGLTGLYIGEAREDRILPNVTRTARFIWRVSLLYAGVGTVALWGALLHAGMPAVDGLLHALMLFMAAFDTGGFAPTSASVGFYHSVAVEAVIAVLMVAGMLSFALHYQLLHRRHRVLVRNAEVRFLAGSILVLFAVTAVGLMRSGAYETVEALYRRGFFQLVSAHTGTGFGSIPGRLFVTDWGALAPAMIVVAMALGGMAGSTTGGIKALRIALIHRFLRGEMRRLLLPRDAVIVNSYDSGGVRRTVDPAAVQTAITILLLYVALYLAGAAVGLFYGYSFEESMFESTSAAAAVGLSIGMTGPNLESGLKLTYIAQMWIGRLEFVAVLVLAGYGLSLLRGRT